MDIMAMLSQLFGNNPGAGNPSGQGNPYAGLVGGTGGQQDPRRAGGTGGDMGSLMRKIKEMQAQKKIGQRPQAIAPQAREGGGGQVMALRQLMNNMIGR